MSKLPTLLACAEFIRSQLHASSATNKYTFPISTRALAAACLYPRMSPCSHVVTSSKATCVPQRWRVLKSRPFCTGNRHMVMRCSRCGKSCGKSCGGWHILVVRSLCTTALCCEAMLTPTVRYR